MATLSERLAVTDARITAVENEQKKMQKQLDDQYWSHIALKRKVEDMGKHLHYVCEGFSRLEETYKLHVETRSDDSLGWNEVKRQLPDLAGEQLAVHLGLAWPLLTEASEDYMGLDDDKKKYIGAILDLMTAFRRDNVSNVQVQYRGEGDGPRTRIGGTFIVHVHSNTGATVAAVEALKVLDIPMRLYSDMKVKTRAGDEVPALPPLGNLVPVFAPDAKRNKVLVYFDKTGSEKERAVRAKAQASGADGQAAAGGKAKGKGKGKGKKGGKDGGKQDRGRGGRGARGRGY